MYTAIRITWPGEKSPRVASLVRDLAERYPAAHLEVRTRGDGCGIEISGLPSWQEHHTAILLYLSEHRDMLQSARTTGAVLVVDVAVDPEDRSGHPWSEIAAAPAMVEALARVGAAFVVTMYPGPVLELTGDEALVLDAWLARVIEVGPPGIEDQAELRAIWNLAAHLESQLTEPLLPNYGELLAQARDRLRDVEE